MYHEAPSPLLLVSRDVAARHGRGTDMRDQGVVELDPEHGLGVVRSMPEFRTHIAQGPLTEAEREVLVDQAEILLESLYVHLTLKRAMHAVDPLQRLRLLRHRLAELTEMEFHTELQRTFLGLRDLHTNYILPARFRGFAFLGILIERCAGPAGPTWLVTKTFDHLTGDPQLAVGAEVTHWNGTPMAIAVERNAAREAGSNKAASLSRGLENMTLRPVSMSLPPDEDWVDVTYVSGGPGGPGEVHQTRLPWRVFESADEVTGQAAPTSPADPPDPSGSAGLLGGVSTTPSRLVGLDLRTELVRQAKRQLFAPRSLDEEARVVADGPDAPEATEEQQAAGVVPTTRPAELKARIVETPHGSFGHLRIYTFSVRNGEIEEFVNEVARLLSVLPSRGLVLDVRGNGGGYVIASEFLLQFFSPGRISPEPMQFISNRATAELCRQVTDYGPWRASIDESIITGAPFSSAIPLYPADLVNSVGQRYLGPVVLVTDAQCYSATDIFAAGFQDHGIGPVLGVDANTGAGGANVVTHEDLRTDWAGGPLRRLPKGAAYRVALRRCLRVGARSGQPVEDLGVVPDERHELTRRDVLEDNADLMERAGRLLAARRPRTMTVTAQTAGAGRTRLDITTVAVSSVDVYVAARPVATTALVDGVTQLEIPTPPGGTLVRVEGFEDRSLVASRQLTA
jgi:Peptidase family S41